MHGDHDHDHEYDDHDDHQHDDLDDMLPARPRRRISAIHAAAMQLRDWSLGGDWVRVP